MATRQKGQRKKAPGSVGVLQVEVCREEDKEQEITVRREQTLQKANSTWSWHQEFTLEWSETLITRKK